MASDTPTPLTDRLVESGFNHEFIAHARRLERRCAALEAYVQKDAQMKCRCESTAYSNCRPCQARDLLEKRHDA